MTKKSINNCAKWIVNLKCKQIDDFRWRFWTSTSVWSCITSMMLISDTIFCIHQKPVCYELWPIYTITGKRNPIFRSYISEIFDICLVFLKVIVEKPLYSTVHVMDSDWWPLTVDLQTNHTMTLKTLTWNDFQPWQLTSILCMGSDLRPSNQASRL